MSRYPRERTRHGVVIAGEPSVRLVYLPSIISYFSFLSSQSNIWFGCHQIRCLGYLVFWYFEFRLVIQARYLTCVHHPVSYSHTSAFVLLLIFWGDSFKPLFVWFNRIIMVVWPTQCWILHSSVRAHTALFEHTQLCSSTHSSVRAHQHTHTVLFKHTHLCSST